MRVAAILVLLAFVGSSYQFPEVTTIGPPYETCQDFLDLCLAIDVSPSVSNSADRMKQAARNLVNTIDANNPNIHVAIVGFSNTVESSVLTGNPNILLTFIDTLQTGPEGTLTDQAISRCIDIMGRRPPNRANNPVDIIVMTDGISTRPDETRRQAGLAKLQNFNMFAVGVNVGSQLYLKELYDMVSDNAKVFTLNEIAEAPLFLESLAKTICAYTVCSSCVADEGTGHAPHLKQCDKFYTCARRSDGHLIAREMTCPLNTLWHRRHSTCDHRENVIGVEIAGCDYCTPRRTLTNYAIGDHCKIYYSCGGDDGVAINCCPSGQRFNPLTGQCDVITSATAGCGNPYYSGSGCKEYFTCTGVGETTWTGRCCDGTNGYWNQATGACEQDQYCMGSCDTSSINKHWCKNTIRSQQNPCGYATRVGDVLIENKCPDGLSYSESVCECVKDDACKVVGPRNTIACTPDVGINFNDLVIVNGTSFGDTTKNRWVDGFNVSYADNTMRSRRGFIAMPYYSNNPFSTNTFLLRLRFKDDYLSPLARSSNRMCLASNQPCRQDFQETKNEASITVDMVPSLGQVSCMVRTRSPTTPKQTVTVQCPPESGPTWKEVTYKYRNNPGLLECCCAVCVVDSAGNKLCDNKVCQGETNIGGQILTSSCALKIGKCRDQDGHAIGEIDDITIYDSCTNDTYIPNVRDRF